MTMILRPLLGQITSQGTMTPTQSCDDGKGPCKTHCAEQRSNVQARGRSESAPEAKIPSVRGNKVNVAPVLPWLESEEHHKTIPLSCFQAMKGSWVQADRNHASSNCLNRAWNLAIKDVVPQN